MINRPGIFLAVGTQLTYQRPNEIRSRNGESITAPGPLTEDLHVYVRHKLGHTMEAVPYSNAQTLYTNNTTCTTMLYVIKFHKPLISLSLQQLIYQQPGPSVYYEYIVPFQNTPPTPEPDPPSDSLPLGECTH